MTIYIQRGSNIFPQEDAENYSDKLQLGTYTVAFNPLIGFFLERTTSLSDIPKKLYGNIESRAERILHTFMDRKRNIKNTGVLLTGVKGSGKTMLSRYLSKILLEKEKIPTIIVGKVVNEDNVGEFVKFMNKIDSTVMVLFDEFEKNFSENVQPFLLSLFDGISGGIKLYVLTMNDVWKINSYMINRPGRMYYHFNYNGLEKEFILEYLQDNLNNKDLVSETVEQIDATFKNSFTVDMLQTVVEEMNRYQEQFKDVVQHLNVDVKDVGYEVDLYVGNELIVSGYKIGNIDYFCVLDEKNDTTVYFEEENFVNFDSKSRRMIFERRYGGRHYTAKVSTTETSNKNRSFFFDAF